MRRPQFLGASPTALIGQTTTSEAVTRRATQPKTAGKLLVTLGMQDHASDEHLAMYSAFGVEHICGAVPSRTLDEKSSVEGLTLASELRRNRKERVPEHHARKVS